MDSSLVRFGKYLLLERINIGGMAEVFRAKTFGVEGFERIVAIKRILPSLVEDDEFVTMFIDEARIAVQLNHPNITQIYELGKHGEHYYIAMEFLASRDLRLILDRLNEQEQLMPVPQAAYIATKICEALDYAHRKRDPGGTPMNIIHRDVSPQNILVSFDGDVKMIDFGIAKAANRASKTQVGVLKGKFAYMSPEQVRGLPIDRRSDVFAVGIVLYEMLTGERLFIAESDFSTLQKVRDAVVEPPSKFNRKITPELEQIVMSALAREVDDRYQWTSELADALQPYLIEGRTIYGAKNLETFVRETYAAEIAIEHEKMEQFREVRSAGLEFDEVSEETEPQSPKETLNRMTQEAEAIEESSEESETIILEASNIQHETNYVGGTEEHEKIQLAEDVASQAMQGDVTAEYEDDDEDIDSDVTIVQMATSFSLDKGIKEAVKPKSNEYDAAVIKEEAALTNADFQPGMTHPSQESELPTIAMPAEDIPGLSDAFHRADDASAVDPLMSGENPSMTVMSGENPSMTVPDSTRQNVDVKSNEPTLSPSTVGRDIVSTPTVSATEETKAIDAAAILPLLNMESSSVTQQVDPHRSKTQVFAHDITASHQILPEDSLALEPSALGGGGSFSDFYGSAKSNNPFVSTLASWIRLIPKAFRMPVFMMIGAIGALFMILMVVGSLRIINTPVGHIELQKMPGEELPVGLKIYLDNQLAGATLPLTISSVSVGEHQIRAEAEADCDAPDFEVKVLAGQSVFLPMSIKCGAEKVVPEKKPEVWKEWQVEVRVLTQSKENIANAIVYMGDLKKTKAPFEANFPRSVASVKIKVEAEGFESQKLTATHNGVMRPPPILVELQKSKKVVIAQPKAAKTPTKKIPSGSGSFKGFKKTTQTGSLEIATSPSAQVYVDGKNTGLTTPIYSSRALKLPIGTHILDFRVKGKRKGYKYRVQVKGDSPENKLVIQKLGKDKIRVYGYISARSIK